MGEGVYERESLGLEVTDGGSFEGLVAVAPEAARDFGE